jgi:site-specific DNA recombinase
MAGYIRESDPSLADSITIESQAKAVRQYAEKEGYLYDVIVHEFKEAISAYTVPYMQREKLLKLLQAAKRREFDVLAVTEIRAISRRQVEVFIIYDILQKYGVRLETIKEKFEDDAMGRVILGLRAGFAEIEREQSYWRMQRGRRDRIEIGKAPNAHSKPAYGYLFVDTKQEVKGRYEFDHTIIYVDKEGREWSPYTVVLFIFDALKKRVSLTGLARILNDMGIPTPKKTTRKGKPGIWQRGSIHTIVTNPIYTGCVFANRFMGVKNPKSGKINTVERPREEWILLPDGTAPVLIDTETWLDIQQQLEINKEDSMRNNSHPREELGLLRAGYIFCGVCGNRMHVTYPAAAAKQRGCSPWYSCQQKNGTTQEHGRHRTQIHIPLIDEVAKEKIVAVLQHPEWVRAKVAELRAETRPVINTADVEATIAHIKRAMQNLYDLATMATTDDTLAEIKQRMNALEEQRREAEGFLYDIADEEEEQAELEAEIVKFEQWAEEVRPQLTNPLYLANATYDELRLALRIIGIRVTVYPTQGEWPYRYKVDVTVPKIMKKLHCGKNDPLLLRPISA